jgi:hypothetical protein
MAKTPPSLALVIAAFGLGVWSVEAQTPSAPSPQKLIEHVVETNRPEQPQLRLFLRLPEGHTVDTPTARGVLAYCTFLSEDKNLRNLILNDDDPRVAFAKSNRLAILTWNTATLWRTGRSYDQIGREDRRARDRLFDDIARAWERGANALCKTHALPTSDFLLYGISRGAHWAGRLALRAPDRFLAVHIHVANSYDQVLGSSAGPLWLVTSGDLDMGRDNAMAFYRALEARKFPAVFKLANALGHSDSSEIEKLGVAFFAYALDAAKRAKGDPVANVMLGDLETSGLTGDFLTQEVYRGDGTLIVPEAQRVPLPNESVARAWGHLRK